MEISGSGAKRWEVIDLTSFHSLPGTLVEADDAIGYAVMANDKTGEQQRFTFGPKRIKIIWKRRP